MLLSMPRADEMRKLKDFAENNLQRDVMRDESGMNPASMSDEHTDKLSLGLKLCPGTC